MAVVPLITKTDADGYNGAAWALLSDAEKDKHIYNASVYMQTSWTCLDVDWEDTSTLNADLEKACAMYAEADMLGLLFAPMAATEKHRAKVLERKKLGSLEKETRWSAIGGFTSGNPLEAIDAIMKVHCYKALDLIRV